MLRQNQEDLRNFLLSFQSVKVLTLLPTVNIHDIESLTKLEQTYFLINITLGQTVVFTRL